MPRAAALFKSLLVHRFMLKEEYIATGNEASPHPTVEQRLCKATFIRNDLRRKARPHCSV